MRSLDADENLKHNHYNIHRHFLVFPLFFCIMSCKICKTVEKTLNTPQTDMLLLTTLNTTYMFLMLLQTRNLRKNVHNELSKQDFQVVINLSAIMKYKQKHTHTQIDSDRVSFIIPHILPVSICSICWLGADDLNNKQILYFILLYFIRNVNTDANRTS